MSWKSYILGGAFLGVFALGAMFAPIEQPSATTENNQNSGLAVVEMVAEDETNQQESSEFNSSKNGAQVGRGSGMGMMGGGRGMGMMGMGNSISGTIHDVIEEELGMTLEEIQAARSEGKSVADLAEEKGVKVEDLLAKLLQSKKTILEQYVKEGNMTQEQMDFMLENMETMLKTMIESDEIGPMHGQGGMGSGHCNQSTDTPAATNTLNEL